MKRIIQLSFFLFVIFSTKLNAQVNVTANNNATALAQNLVGFGVTVSNATLDCGSLASNNVDYGSGMFTVTSSNLGLDAGIVLTSGVAATTGTVTGVNGPGNFVSNSTFGTFPASQALLGYDADLSLLINGTTYDKCVLEFDFTTIGDTVKFDYVFGSQEYETWTCTGFNDVFGFFISGAGITGPYSNNSKNIALVPGSTTCPVAISTIFCPNNPGCCNTSSYCFGNTPGCGAFSAANNTCAYFVCNPAGPTINYPGFTTVLTAMSPVTPCSTYHLKLAIADKGDGAYDSGVFLKAGSFSSNVVKVKLNSGLTSTSGSPVLVEGCDSAALTITRKIVAGTAYADTINFIIAGNAQNGIDYTTLPSQVTFIANPNDTVRTLNLYAFPDGLAEGTEYIKIYLLSGCQNLITDSLIIEVRDSLGFQLFNIDTAICLGNTVTINGTQDIGLNLTWSPTTNILNPNILLTTITPTSIGSQVYTASATYGSCAPVSKSFKITTDPVPVITPIADFELCEGRTFDIHAIVTPPFNYNIVWNPSSGLTNTNGLNPTFVGTTNQTIDLTVTSPNAGCTATDNFTATVWPFQQGTIKSDTLICNGEPVQLWVTGGTGNYQWYPATNLSCEFCPNPVASGLGSERYFAILLDVHGCQDTLNVFIETHPPFNLNLLNNDTTIYLGESIQLMATGAPFYYWSPTTYISYNQSNDPLATPLADITYHVTGVSLLQGCPQSDSFTVHVIEQNVYVPNAFSPNGDGLNDFFHVTARKLVTVQEFKIFNRWGQEIFSTDDISLGWNGQFKGINQDPGVYYYMIKTSTPTGKHENLKGDFTLIR